MAHHVELGYCALTDKGMVRAQNEDSVAVLPELGVSILADGMGGYRAGEVASRVAVDVCIKELEQQLQAFDWRAGGERSRRLTRIVQDAVAAANCAIYNASQQQEQYSGMGTTLVVTLMHHDKLLIAHVGDSRAYRLRDTRLEQITRDHSQVQEQVDAGLLTPHQARSAPNRNLVTRAMGIDRQVEVELHRFTTKPGDMYLICSDGLSDMVNDAEIADVLYSGATLEGAASDLVARANLMGGLTISR